ncbi:molybdopterin converting factor subunit 1 [Virgibacillus xinjiangensis]|uniref:Molybdopterin synthase sulfur carrier subunit n=1 Tax=Virgibacillus xinjiangensis TaxID=393090 RepID=A0ABV7CWH8_9BACI
MINVLLFAQLQEEAGRDRLEVEMGETTVKELKQRLQDSFQLGRLESTMAAVNEEYARDEDTVKPGDTVAFIPPVSGG